MSTAHCACTLHTNSGFSISEPDCLVRDTYLIRVLTLKVHIYGILSSTYGLIFRGLPPAPYAYWPTHQIEDGSYSRFYPFFGIDVSHNQLTSFPADLALKLHDLQSFLVNGQWQHSSRIGRYPVSSTETTQKGLETLSFNPYVAPLKVTLKIPILMHFCPWKVAVVVHGCQSLEFGVSY